MNNPFDSAQFAEELAELQQQIETARKEAFNSMREVVAYRLFGGEGSMWDEAEVVFVAVDEHGAPNEIRVRSDWKDEYSPVELGEAIALLARTVEDERVARAKQHIADYPEDLDSISDAEVERLFQEAQQKQQVAGRTDDLREMDATAAAISEEVTELYESTAELRSGDVATPDLERPVSILTMGGMLIGIRLNPDFIQRSTTVQINAAIAEEINRVNSGEEADESSTAERLRNVSAKARAYADALRSQTQSVPSAFTRK